MPSVPAPMNVAGYVFRFAQGSAGDRPAITSAMGSLTYREFAGRVLRFAGALRERGVGPGDRVTLYLRSSQEFFEAFFATLSLGAGVVPVVKPEPSRAMASIRRCRSSARDAGERSAPRRENQTSMAALPQEITDPARARR